jgi:MoxR-like ATPase
MFNIWLDYPKYEEELNVVKRTTTGASTQLQNVLTAEEILKYQELIRKIPVADNVYEYAVKLAASTRPDTPTAGPRVNEFVNWGAGPRASQYLIIGAKTHAALNGKFSPDIENVRAVANPILRHRIVRNYKAEAEGITVEDIIAGLVA